MGNIWSLFKVLEVLVLAFQYVAGIIDRAVFEQRLSAIGDAVSKAKEGPLEKRLEGGKELEDIANRNSK